MPLEILHLALVLFGLLACGEGAKIAALAGLGVNFSRVKAVFAGLQFADHCAASISWRTCGGSSPSQAGCWAVPSNIEVVLNGSNLPCRAAASVFSSKPRTVGS